MNAVDKSSEQALRATIAKYNDAWNAHGLDAILAMHADEMVFADHSAGESASGEDVRDHIAAIFEA
ncbi:MAG: nuclear transport factor 2 family protein [Solirubrobacterales bacterium]